MGENGSVRRAPRGYDSENPKLPPNTIPVKTETRSIPEPPVPSRGVFPRVEARRVVERWDKALITIRKVAGWVWQRTRLGAIFSFYWALIDSITHGRAFWIVSRLRDPIAFRLRRFVLDMRVLLIITRVRSSVGFYADWKLYWIANLMHKCKYFCQCRFKRVRKYYTVCCNLWFFFQFYCELVNWNIKVFVYYTMYNANRTINIRTFTQ